MTIDDQARSALATMSPPMRQALARVAGSDTDIHDRELASLRARGLITNAGQITILGCAVHDRLNAFGHPTEIVRWGDGQ